MSDDRCAGGNEQIYWLVYLYYYEPEEPGGFLWDAVGLVEDRQTWMDWWDKVLAGEIDLPNQYKGWWCSDRPVSFGLYGTENDQ